MHEVGFETWLSKAKEGVTKFLILLLLSQTPLHGYALMKLIRNCTGGWLRSTSGNIYPLLREMENQGLVKGVWMKEEASVRKRKCYHITDKGLKELSEMLEERRQMAKAFALLLKKSAFHSNLTFPPPFSPPFPPPPILFPPSFLPPSPSFSDLSLKEVDSLIQHLTLKKEVIESLIQELTKLKALLERDKGENE
ncbi:MAG: PadR family transcriptional regulator [Candidatus Freyarchaeota archaeon]|nr:PadR family transcriptional regulator [Candidatus Jordarchaeia archaeon]